MIGYMFKLNGVLWFPALDSEHEVKDYISLNFGFLVLDTGDIVKVCVEEL